MSANIFSGWTERGDYRAERVMKDTYKVYERNGDAFVLCATVYAKNGFHAINKVRESQMFQD